MPHSSNLPLLLLIDGHSLAFRAYYAFAKARRGPLRTSTGIPTSICFGFLNSLIQVIKLEKPEYIAIAFDTAQPTFRHEADANYKADRKETPEDFIPDIQNLQRLLEALNITIIKAPGYEADDILGTVATQGTEKGYRVKIVSGDRDLFQLVDDEKKISVLYLERNAVKSSSGEGYTEFDIPGVTEKIGIKPTQVIDYKALCGDKSDNIPGVRGIGEKTAVKLLNEYGTLEEVYNNIEKIKGANQKKLKEGKKEAEHSQFLATIITDVPFEFKAEECELKGFNFDAVKPVLEELELKKFIKEINQLQEDLGGNITLEFEEKVNKNETHQLSLFDNTSKQEETVNETDEDEKESLIKPQIITETEQLEELVHKLSTFTNAEIPIAWDTETTDLNPRQAELVGIGCCWGNKPTDIAYIPIAHTQGKQLPKEKVLNTLRAILEDSHYPKVFQNTKFDRLIFKHQGINLNGVVFDTMLASYVLHPEKSHKLSELCEQYLHGITSKNYSELGIGKKQTIADLDIETVAEYCGMDAYGTFLLVEPIKQELKAVSTLEKLLLEVEQPLEAVLSIMEDTGIVIDTEYLGKLSKELEGNLLTLEEKAYQAAGETFNLGSPKQLGEILFDKLELNRKKSRKTKTGYSTDHATLEKLKGDHPIIDYILEYRTLSKLKSTYIDALPELVDKQTKRIHTNFNQSVTTTGRLSSSNPNLQNIPIRTEFSRQIRQAFIPEEKWSLVSADYSQIELRILAHLSQEPVLLNAYQNAQDVHSVTAKLLFDKEKITPQERTLGKTINFGVIYGMGSQRFAREAGVSPAEGKEFINKYRQRYAKVFQYLESMKKEAIANGYVTTILGRRRYFNFFDDNLYRFRGHDPQTIDLNKININYNDSQLLRAAANAPIQGSSADIIKIAMVKIQEILNNYRANLLLQVHDELVFEIPAKEWEELETKIKTTMESAVTLTVPLIVDIHAGKNWMEAK
ncbi:DNA polymerase I [Crocosphaera sp. Alani8]|uniref:DNA polymerase I n=1 Tax=Crocosphaera sp. Alani8 TaxID=3038952 RepID=UPI00313E5A1A